jgi:hypothetical protein
MKHAFGAAAAALILFLVQPAFATYDLTSDLDGPDVPGAYTTSMSIQGSMTFASPIPSGFFGFVTPESFSFFDGRFTITNLNSVPSFLNFNVSTFPPGPQEGQIYLWSIGVQTSLDQHTDPGMFNSISISQSGNRAVVSVCLLFVAGECLGGGEETATSAGGGVWLGPVEVAAATPLPAALPLFASGLGVLGFGAYRRKRKPVSA